MSGKLSKYRHINIMTKYYYEPRECDTHAEIQCTRTGKFSAMPPTISITVSQIMNLDVLESGVILNLDNGDDKPYSVHVTDNLVTLNQKVSEARYYAEQRMDSHRKIIANRRAGFHIIR